MVKKNNWTNEEDEKLIYFFQKGNYAREIAKKLNRTKGSVDKRVQKLKKEGRLKELRALEREKRRIENREIKRAINRENNNFLSNRATIKASMSAYKNNDKGDLVLDINKAKNQGFVYTMDMPGIIVNEEIREFNKVDKNNKELNVIEYVKKETVRLKEFQKEVRKGIEKISS